MRDFKFEFDALDQRASGTIQITDYTQLSGVTVTIDGNALVEGTDWTAATSNDATATSLASAIDGLAGISSLATTDTVSVYASTPGTAGNSVTMADDSTSGMTLSGATLTGGEDETFSDILDLPENCKEVEELLKITALDGSDVAVDITPQYSFNKIDFDDVPANMQFAQVTHATTLPFTHGLDASFTGLYRRYKIEISGTNAGAVTGKISSVAKQ